MHINNIVYDMESESNKKFARTEKRDMFFVLFALTDA